MLPLLARYPRLRTSASCQALRGTHRLGYPNPEVALRITSLYLVRLEEDGFNLAYILVRAAGDSAHHVHT